MTELLPLVTEPAEPAEPATEVDRIPLALQQDFLRMMDSGSESGPFGPRYTIVAGWRVLGEIDVDTVRRAAEDVVARHETLRTRIVLDDGDPYQHVLPPSPPEVLIRDLTEQGRGDRDLAVEELLNDIESGVSVPNETPRVKVALGRFDHRDSVLVFVAHHTVVDGASVHVLMRDFAACYAARRERRARVLAGLPARRAHASRTDGPAAQRRRLRHRLAPLHAGRRAPAGHAGDGQAHP